MSRSLLSFLAAAAIAAAVGPVLVAYAKDDPAKVKEAREAFKKKLKDAKQFYYFDLWYMVDAPKMKDQRWKWFDPPDAKATEEEQMQFRASLGPADGKDWIVFKVWKFPQYKMVSSTTRQPQGYTFKAWGKNVDMSKIEEICTGFVEDWMKTAEDVAKDESKTAKKTSVGPAEYYGTAVGTDPETKQRQRRDWYVWGNQGANPPATYIVQIDFDKTVLDKEPAMADKALELLKLTKQIDNKAVR